MSGLQAGAQQISRGVFFAKFESNIRDLDDDQVFITEQNADQCNHGVRGTPTYSAELTRTSWNPPLKGIADQKLMTITLYHERCAAKGGGVIPVNPHPDHAS